MLKHSKVKISALEIAGEEEDVIRVTFDMPRIVGMPFRTMGMDFHALTVEEVADLAAHNLTKRNEGLEAAADVLRGYSAEIHIDAILALKVQEGGEEITDLNLDDDWCGDPEEGARS